MNKQLEQARQKVYQLQELQRIAMTKERWDIIKEYFAQKEIEYKEIFSVNGSILTKLINLIYLFDYSTIYRAVLSGIDPTPVNSINFIKSRSKKA